MAVKLTWEGTGVCVVWAMAGGVESMVRGKHQWGMYGVA